MAEALLALALGKSLQFQHPTVSTSYSFNILQFQHSV